MMMKRSTERLVWLVAIVLIGVGLTLWLTQSFRNNMLYFVTPSDLATLQDSHPSKQGKRFRLGGLVLKDSLQRDGASIQFSIVDKQNQTQIIQFTGIPPELFAENKGVIAEGILKNDLFIADRLLTKHDETYKPA